MENDKPNKTTARFIYYSLPLSSFGIVPIQSTGYTGLFHFFTYNLSFTNIGRPTHATSVFSNLQVKIIPLINQIPIIT
jgi:hypothetical protein